MDKRAITFVILSTLLVVGYFAIDQAFRPKAPPNRNQAENQVDENQEGSDDGASGNTPEDETADPAEPDQIKGSDEDTTSTDDVSENGDDSSTSETGELAELVNGTTAASRRLLGLGSLAANSPSRMLVTLDSKGASIRRVELVERESDGELRYQETEHSGGYLGSLELAPLSGGPGAKIQNIGAGTPAAAAASPSSNVGLQVGDILLSATVEEETREIASDWDLDEFLYDYRSGDRVDLLIERNGVTLPYSVTLINRPLQLIAPEPDDAPPELQHQQSMLLQVGSLERGFWEPIAPEMENVDWDSYYFDKILTFETDLYRDGPQQGRPADAKLGVGTLVEVIERSANGDNSDSAAPESSAIGGYLYVRTLDGEQGYVVADAVEDNPDPTIAFSYTIPSKRLEKFKRTGPLQVIKRYRLAAIPPEEEAESEFPAYHIEFAIELRNHSSEPENYAFQLDGPAGVTSEGWWFANKIHGRSTAIGYSAGARDIVGGSVRRPFCFIGGPEIWSNELKRSQGKEDEDIDVFSRQGGEDLRQVRFLGVDAQYFNVSWLPQTPEDQPFVCYSAIGIALHPVTNKQKKERKKINVSFRVTSSSIEVAPYSKETAGSAYVLDSNLFAGPKQPKLLKQYGLSDVISYGWFALFSKLLISILHMFHFVVRNYGLAIILLTLCVRAAMLPISRKAVRNAQMMQHLQPEIKKIAEKYKNDMEKRQKAQSELFKKYNYNPLGGCLLIFFQLPVFIGLYRGLSVDISLRDQPLIPGIEWCSNLAAPDKLLRWDSIPMPFLFSETGWLGPYLNVLPIITVVLFLIQQKMFTPPATDEQTKMTQRMMTYMMLFIGLMFFKVPSGLCIYFITSSLWGICERKLIPKPKLPDSVLALKEATEKADKSGDGKKTGAGIPAKSEPKPDAGDKRRELEKQRRKKRKTK